MKIAVPVENLTGWLREVTTLIDSIKHRLLLLNEDVIENLVDRVSDQLAFLEGILATAPTIDAEPAGEAGEEHPIWMATKGGTNCPNCRAKMDNAGSDEMKIRKVTIETSAGSFILTDKPWSEGEILMFSSERHCGGRQ